MTARALASPAFFLPFNIGLVCLFLVLGAAIPSTSCRLDMSPLQQGMGFPVGDLWVILKNNYGVAARMLCGAFTFGLYPVILLSSNALVLGNDLAGIVKTNPHELRYLFPFLPQEFIAFCLAASAAEYFGLRFFRYLFFGEDFGQVRAGIKFIAWTTALIALAAVVETLCKYARNNGTF